MNNQDPSLVGIKSDYDLNFGKIVKEAWHKVKGVKGAYWGALGWHFLIFIGVNIALTLFTLSATWLFAPEALRSGHQVVHEMSPALISINVLNQLASVAIIFFITFPIALGLFLIAIRRSVDKSVKASFVFKYFHWRYIWRIGLAYILMTVIIFIPAAIAGASFGLASYYDSILAVKIIFWIIGIIFSLLSLYFCISYILTFPIVADRGLGPCRTLKTSRKNITKHWFTVFGIVLFTIVVTFIAAILLLVGLIWVLPWAYNVIGILYREVIGVAGLDPVTQAEDVPDFQG